MKYLHSVNKRIVEEIKNLEAGKSVKMFLQEIIGFELENLDKEKVKYLEEYLRMIDRALADR